MSGGRQGDVCVGGGGGGEGLCCGFVNLVSNTSQPKRPQRVDSALIRG